MKYFSGFTGVGGFEIGISNARPDFECVGFSEIDKWCTYVLSYHYPDIKNYGSIKDIIPEELPDFDLFVGGFPCQDVSIAGKRDLTIGRTMLVNDVFRIIKVKKPKYVLLENVKGLLSMEDFFQSILFTLRGLGYGVIYKVLNSKYFDVPQSRNRIFIFCKLGGWNFLEYKFPENAGQIPKLSSILENNPDKKYYLTPEVIRKIIERRKEMLNKGCHFGYDIERETEIINALCARDCKDGGRPVKIINPIFRDSDYQEYDDISMTLTKIMKCPYVSKIVDNHNYTERKDETFTLTSSGRNSGGNQAVVQACLTPERDRRQLGRRLKNNEEEMFTLTSQDVHRVYSNEEFRTLTPIECERLQGFPSDWTRYGLKDGSKIEISDGHRYSMMGNAVTTNVITAIIKRLK